MSAGARDSLFVPGPLPGMNEIVAAAKGCRGTGRLYAVMKRDWTARVAALAKASRMRAWDAPVRVSFRWVEAARRRDPDNVSAGRKFVFDGLVVAGVLPGDGWRWIAGWEDAFAVDASAPGVEVTIRPAVVD